MVFLKHIPLIFLIFLAGISVNAQHVDSSINSISAALEKLNTNTLHRVERNVSKIEDKLQKSSEKVLNKVRKQEAKLKKELSKKDSLLANTLFDPANKVYEKLSNKIKTSSTILSKSNLNGYVPKLDSFQTAVKFLQSKIPDLDNEKIKSLTSLSSTINELQTKSINAVEIKQFIKERKQLITEQFSKLGLATKLKKLNKDVFYFQQQLSEYKNILNNPDRLTNKLLSVVRELPAFKEFMKQNSMLAQLFPNNYDPSNLQGSPGLQTQLIVSQQLQQITGTNGNFSSPQQIIQQQVQGGQDQLGILKDKANQIAGGSDELTMPDFKPNSQKSKSIWQRLEYGLNIQSQKPNGLLPVTSDLALTIGYKISNKSIIGIGMSYKIGWGKDINNISISSQGIGLRSYVDIKLKGSFWISGGYEQNYMQGFDKIPQLNDYSKWQQSGLIGISKKYKIGKKSGNLQLLWDFLSYRQIPITQPLKFRIGYAF